MTEATQRHCLWKATVSHKHHRHVSVDALVFSLQGRPARTGVHFSAHTELIPTGAQIRSTVTSPSLSLSQFLTFSPHLTDVAPWRPVHFQRSLAASDFWNNQLPRAICHPERLFPWNILVVHGHTLVADPT